jgi:protein subunit release factor A
MTLRHVPTGVTVEGRIARGQYTRKEMGQLMDELKTRVWSDLERQLARHLRIPGR